MENDDKTRNVQNFSDQKSEPVNQNGPNDNATTVAAVSLVFGLLSCIGNMAWGWGSMVCLVLGIVGTLMAINANKKRRTTIGTLGLISSLIGVLISGFGTACLICASVGVSAVACGILSAIH